MDALRKVKYKLSEDLGFIPDLTDEEIKEQEANQTYRQGFFHTWTQIANIDSKTGIPVAETCAVIEDQATCKLEIVSLTMFEFIETVKSQD